MTFDSHADWDATTVTVTGTDENGTAVTDTFAVPNGGGATVNGASAVHFEDHHRREHPRPERRGRHLHHGRSRPR